MGFSLFNSESHLRAAIKSKTTNSKQQIVMRPEQETDGTAAGAHLLGSQCNTGRAAIVAAPLLVLAGSLINY